MVKICYACSAGGHLEEISPLIAQVKCDEYYFVTINRTDSRSILKNKKVFFVTDTNRNIVSTIRNFFQSINIFLKNKPDIIITIGAGVALATCIIAKVYGRKIVFIETLAKIDTPSLFGRFLYPIADITLLQWKEQKRFYKKGKYIGPLLNFQNLRKPKKKKQIFVTVGTNQFPFDRMIAEMDKLAKTTLKRYKVFAQIGNSHYIPRNIKFKKFLEYSEMKTLYKNSEIVVCQAGVGSITNALSNNCKTIIVPRYKRLGEHVDNHQLDISKKFDKMRLLEVAYKIEDLRKKIQIIITRKNTIKFKNYSIIKYNINEYLTNKM